MDILTTMITPFQADGSIDYETALKYVDWYFADSNFAGMSEDEKALLFKQKMGCAYHIPFNYFILLYSVK